MILLRQVFIFDAKVTNVVDADTIDAVIDLGFNTSRTDRIRLFGINAYETRLSSTTTAQMKELGLQGKVFLTDLILGRNVLVRTEPDREKYGRYLATVYMLSTDSSLVFNNVQDYQGALETVEGNTYVNINKLVILKGYGVEQVY